jgi:phospholipid/cholesterol/gamma-HCH transport system substrate-binding protein
MKESSRSPVWQVAIYTIVCLLCIFAVFMVYGQFRFNSVRTYYAQFTNASGLKSGNFVRIAGVEVGKVKSVNVEPDTTVRVEFSADDSVVLTEGTRALIRYDDLVGGRFMALQDAPGGVNTLNPGATIPITQTEPALDLDVLVNGLRPVYRALKPDQVNALTGQLVSALQGQGGTIDSILTQSASLTNTLADRDLLIGQVITSLNVLLGSLAGKSDQLAKTVDSVSDLVAGLQARHQDITNGLAYANAAAGSIADLLSQARPPLKKVVHEADRTAGIVVADHDYVDNLLNTYPDAFQAVGGQALFGDFFSFYICDALLKMNGKGGQPVYIKVAGQDTGRCTPK